MSISICTKGAMHWDSYSWENYNWETAVGIIIKQAVHWDNYNWEGYDWEATFGIIIKQAVYWDSYNGAAATFGIIIRQPCAGAKKSATLGQSAKSSSDVIKHAHNHGHLLGTWYQ